MYFFISLDHHQLLNICSFHHSHSDSIQDDFMVSASSFNVTQLRASAATLSCPFWYSMLNMNLASDSTHHCHHVASKLGEIYDVGEQTVVTADNEWFPV